MNKMEKSTKDISKRLNVTRESRELILKKSRDVITLASTAIINAHRKDLKTAKNNVKKAEKVLKELKKKSQTSTARYIISPETEVVEAIVFIKIIEKKDIPTQKELNVNDASYLLGLLDCVGEIKRLVLDSIRTGNLEDAKMLFEIMERIYLTILPLATFDKVVDGGLRRKLDVSRSLIESVRAVITEEVRREELIKQMKNRQ